MKFRDYIRRFPVTSYFILTFAISWGGAVAVVAPELLHGVAISKSKGILEFPAMIIGPIAAGIFLTALCEGKAGLKNLMHRLGTGRVAAKWYIVSLSVPPLLISLTLLLLANFVSPIFAPNLFPVGFLFGIPAGFFEEIGWTGFAFPKIVARVGVFKSAVIVGSLWGLWHLPVIDSLGAAGPHGQYLLPFFIAFIAILTAIRFFIAWIYKNTNSILLAQVMHAVSTGSLVMLGPFAVSPSQEVLWYTAYGLLLWIVVFLMVIVRCRPDNPK